MSPIGKPLRVIRVPRRVITTVPVRPKTEPIPGHDPNPIPITQPDRISVPDWPKKVPVEQPQDSRKEQR